MKCLDLDKLQYIGEGAYGEYYKIKGSKMGVKVSNYSVYDSHASAMDSSDFSDVKSEFNRLKRISSITRLVPKSGELVLIREWDGYNIGYKYRIGYTMAHIDGRPVGDSRMSDKDYAALERSRKLLKSKGIEQHDDHNYNVLKVKSRPRRKFVFVDAGSMDLSVKRRSRS